MEVCRLCSLNSEHRAGLNGNGTVAPRFTVHGSGFDPEETELIKSPKAQHLYQLTNCINNFVDPEL